MKNILNYYYHIIVNDDDIVNGYFTYHDYHFCIQEYQRSLSEVNALVSVNNDFIQNHLLINQIVLNINNEPLTFNKNKYYYLLIVENSQQNGYHFVEAIVNNTNKILLRNNWDFLWSSKVDYIEYQLSCLDNDYPLINDSVYYFLGLTENAISYFKRIKKEGIPLYYNHRRITSNNLYNPMEIIIDYKVRDISEYLKEIFINDRKSINDILNIIEQFDFNYFDYLFLYNRMLYPSFYFDLYEQIINNNMDEKKIELIINQIDQYEELLYNIYAFVNRRYSIIGIEWINQKYLSK